MGQLYDTTTSAAGVWGAVKGALGLFDDVNKTPTTGDQSVEGQDEYSSTYSDTDVLGLTKEWSDKYVNYYTDIEKTQSAAYAYWLGQQKTSAIDNIEGTNIVDNLIFEALETFLPIATRANPDPLVSSDNSDEGQALAKDVKDALVYQADKQKLRMKLKSVTRNWALLRLGVIEVSYDYQTDDIKTTVINSKRVLLDPKGHIDESGLFTGDWIGVRHDFSVSTLKKMFPKKAQKILEKGNNKEGTKLEIIKWWYKGTDVFFTLDHDVVLDKKKNPHWNYDGVITINDPETGSNAEVEIQGRNHYPQPISPYVFLGVFKTGLQPHDDTSLILQNIGIQDQINKRWRQLDRNVEGMNNGIVVNGKLMTQEQAAEAASALRRGASIRVMGDPREAFMRAEVPALPGDVWKSLVDAREQLKNIFGISGATPSGIAREETARGKILTNQLDSSRIGGGVTEYIEQVADTVYNLYVQMMYVHYDNEHFINTLGVEQGSEMAALRNTRFTRNLVVTVKEGSLIPKDPLTERNEAVDLWSAQAIDPITLYKKLDYPDPMGAAKQLLLWQMVQKGVAPPQAYIPDFESPAVLSPIQGVNAPGFNPLGQEGPPPPEVDSPGAAQLESKQLMGSVPLQ